MTCYIVISKPHQDQTSWMVEGYIHAKNKEEAINEAIQYLPTDHIAVYPYLKLDEEAQMDAVQRGNLKKRCGGLTYQQMCPEYPEQSCA